MRGYDVLAQLHGTGRHELLLQVDANGTQDSERRALVTN